MKVLVTGGSGFIGRNVVDALVSSGHEVLVTARPKTTISEKWFNSSVIVARFPLDSKKAIVECLRGFRPEIVIHLAWEGIPDFSVEQCLRNIEISSNLFDAIAIAPSIRRLVIAGSCKEYGDKNGICLESDPVSPSDEFGRAKTKVRNYAEVLCHKAGIELCWLRIFYVYGPGQRAASLLPTVISGLRKGGMMPTLSDPARAHDFIHIHDLIELFNAIVESEFIKSGIYNAGTGSVTPLGKLCNLALLRFNELAASSVSAELFEENMYATGAVACVDRSMLEFNWRATTTVEEGVRSFVEHSFDTVI